MLVSEASVHHRFRLTKSLRVKLYYIFLSVTGFSFNMCFGSSKEPSHSEGSFEYIYFGREIRKAILCDTLLTTLCRHKC